MPAKDHSKARSNSREALAAALMTTTDSDHHFWQQQSAGNESDSPLGPAAGNMHAHGAGRAAPETSESMSQPSPKRARRMSDVPAEVKPVPQIGPDHPRRAAITTDETTEEKKVRIHKAQRFAFIIEKRIFESSGGVNTEYKEKCVSLLLKLQDGNNPVLRERVLSGDITPKCLCAMTIDEPASEELSESPMAKPEERASTVVIPDIEVDVGWLVRKTRKRKSQAKVEETDAMEAGLGGAGSLISNAQPKSVDKKSVHKVTESDNSAQDGVAETCNSDTSSNLEYPSNEKNDLMQEPMVDDAEFKENLPQIMTLLEFMQLLHSESHSADQSAAAPQDDPSIDKALKSESSPIAKDKAAALKFQIHCDLRSPQENYEYKLESPINKSVSIMDPVLEPKGDVIVKSPDENVDAKKPDTVNGSVPESKMQCKITPDVALSRDNIWEGTIQLGLFEATNIVAIFKSGEKPSTNEWPSVLEIKERVSLSVLKEYIEGLANSGRRAIMVTEICSKEGSLESGRRHPLQIIDSHIADGRGVGLVKPAEGVAIYLCPQGEAAKILADHQPKEHSGSLTLTETSIIGLVVWRRPLPNISPNRQDVPKSRAMISGSAVPRISQPPPPSSNACRSHQDVVTADCLPGFGPGVVKDDDADLPASASQTNRSQWHTSLSEFEIRELVRKYG
uniref:Uncharacterized protein n=1 Tax=Avena sativa TaxID=4498 RepID=A0ACD5TR59_AVESA